MLVLALAFSGHAKSMEQVQVAADGTNFVLRESKRMFVPRGFNYDRDYKMRLIEEYWDSEWDTVVADFQEMKQLGANVVRIHLQLPKFMDGPDKPNRHALTRLSKLLRLAEKTSLYLDLTGLACYRKADVPPWLERLDEQQRWAAQASFWGTIAKCCAKSPAVFCYDLINEPLVPAGKTPSWLVGQLAGFYYVQAIALDPAGRERPSIAVSWTKEMVAAVRKYDRQHLITIGLLPESADAAGGSGFVPAQLAPMLDFICIHLYPRSGHLEDDLQNLRRFSVGRPLVIEEIYPMTVTLAELETFLSASEKIANGWIGFYWGVTRDELQKSKKINDRVTLEWLNLFERLNTKQSSQKAR